MQKQHVGIYGQWIDTWRPRKDSKELAIILEDDVDLSPWAYIWLKACHEKYRDIPVNGGYSLYEGALAGLRHVSSKEPVFMFPRLGTQAYAPHPKWWVKFQDWFHSVNHKSFHPYVKNDPLVSGWYKGFERKHKANSMWSMWYIYFADNHKLHTLYSNIAQSMPRLHKQYLAYHRQEHGLHFRTPKRKSDGMLIVNWNNSFIDFPKTPQRYNLKGRLVNNK